MKIVNITALIVGLILLANILGAAWQKNYHSLFGWIAAVVLLIGSWIEYTNNYNKSN